MPKGNIFALDRSGFNGFLFAGIGLETNGSCLTVLSALARLGKDPWTTAASWTAMSHAAATEALAACIAQMPLTAADLREAPTTAARLVLLLSPAGVAPLQRFRAPVASTRARTALTILSAIACAGMLIGGAFLAARHVTPAVLPGSASPLER